MLTHELGAAMDWFNQICVFIGNDFGNLSREWKYYGQKSGWVLKLIHKKRNLFFVVPLHGSFRVVFTFGDKAFYAIMDGNAPGYIQQALLDATKYAEGRTIQLHMHSYEQLQPILELIKIKHSY